MNLRGAAAAGVAAGAVCCACRTCLGRPAELDLEQMPKVELHAHLGGSLRIETVNELLLEKGLGHLQVRASRQQDGDAEHSMNECFKLFDAVYKVTDKLSVIHRVTKEVIQDYSRERTAFLELRTSLKSLEGRPAEEYLDTVLQAIDEANHELGHAARVPTRLLVSINRGGPAAMAEEAVRLALSKRDRDGCRVSGIDFSGNCYKGEWETFEPFLSKAKREGLPTTLHAGEKDDDPELTKMLDFGPDRLGHLVYCGPAVRERIRGMGVPVEFCLTSNMITGCLKDAREHHVERWWGHPFSVNTDDRGIFSCTLAGEFALLRDAYGLSSQRVLDIAASAVNHTFLPECERRELRRIYVAHAHKAGLKNPYEPAL